MREKLNSNPMAQAGIILILLLGVGFFLLKGSGGEESEEVPPTEATVSVAGTGVSGTATAETPGAAVEGAITAATEGVTSASSSVTSLPAAPLPKAVTDAYDADKTVVLLIVHDGGIDDQLARKSVASLGSMSDVALFVVPVHQISRYAAITLGVDVNRVPALVVMRPKDLSEGSPQASVGYGLQSPQSVEQAVLDAGYDGPTTSYHPE
jgi:hypothetical protein